MKRTAARLGVAALVALLAGCGEAQGTRFVIETATPTTSPEENSPAPTASPSAIEPATGGEATPIPGAGGSSSTAPMREASSTARSRSQEPPACLIRQLWWSSSMRLATSWAGPAPPQPPPCRHSVTSRLTSITRGPGREALARSRPTASRLTELLQPGITSSASASVRRNAPRGPLRTSSSSMMRLTVIAAFALAMLGTVPATKAGAEGAFVCIDQSGGRAGVAATGHARSYARASRATRVQDAGRIRGRCQLWYRVVLRGLHTR